MKPRPGSKKAESGKATNIANTKGRDDKRSPLC